MNSRRKGKVGEREFAALLREHGFEARRGQQFAGGADSPDVVSPALAWLHIEVKRTQALNLAGACAQAEGDCAGKPWVVAHRRNHAPWLVTMTSDVFFNFLRGVLPPEGDGEVQGARSEAHGARDGGQRSEDRGQRSEMEDRRFEISKPHGAAVEAEDSQQTNETEKAT